MTGIAGISTRLKNTLARKEWIYFRTFTSSFGRSVSSTVLTTWWHQLMLIRYFARNGTENVPTYTISKTRKSKSELNYALTNRRGSSENSETENL